jgi:DNA primase
MAVDVLLSRLSKVKKTGRDKWQACCPAHEDKTPSLTIRELDDGRILIHCFGGCGACDVMDSLGLEMTELFPERLGEFKQIAQPFSAADALRALTRESAIVAIAAADAIEGKPQHPDDAQRIAVAAARIAEALEYVNAA